MPLQFRIPGVEKYKDKAKFLLVQSGRNPFKGKRLIDMRNYICNIFFQRDSIKLSGC
jgi:hypothetical protein